MGRFPNIAASKAKTGAAKGKLYGMYAKEIYQLAKNGGVNPDGNPALKRLIDKAKKDQVPTDVIKRAIDKVNSGTKEDYQTLMYEIFGPNGSTIMVECLTDNTNRSISDLRAVINKCHVKIGAMGSVSYMYDNLCVVGFSGIDIDTVMDLLIENNIDFIDIENENNQIIIYAEPNFLYNIKQAILDYKNDIEFIVDEISYLPKDKINLIGEDLELFNKLISMIEDIEDVKKVYHNVEV